MARTKQTARKDGPHPVGQAVPLVTQPLISRQRARRRRIVRLPRQAPRTSVRVRRPPARRRPAGSSRAVGPATVHIEDGLIDLTQDEVCSVILDYVTWNLE